MAKKERVIFQQSSDTKTRIKHELVGVFKFCFHLWEA